MPKVSVIIPVYNVEKYLAQCLDSVVNQTLADIEIICVNDGSTDSSPEILKQYAKSYENIVIVDQENQGVGIARNNGMKKASGEFIAFMDSDDYYLENGTLEKLYSKAKEHNVKICGGSLSEDHNDGKWIRKEFLGVYTKYTFKEEGLVQYKDYQFDFGYYRFIYDRKFLLENDIFFPPLIRFQDPPFFVKAMICAKEFYAIPDCTYCYRYGHQNLVWHEKRVSAFIQGHIDDLNYSAEAKLGELHALTLHRLLRIGEEPVKQGLFDGGKKVLDLLDLAEKSVVKEILPAEGEYKELAENYPAMFEEFRKYCEDVSQLKTKSIKLLLSYHKPEVLFKDSVLTPVHAGRANALKKMSADDEKLKWLMENTIGDDTGENISEKNGTFNEMTTVYWAWKNYGEIGSPDFIGFMHYRRHFIFDDKLEKAQYEAEEIGDDYFDQIKYNEKEIIKIMSGCDFVCTKPQWRKSMYEHYRLNHEIADLETAVQIIKERHPEYVSAAEKYLDGQDAYFCNMFVFPKEIFFEYCEWFFDIALELTKRNDFTNKRLFVSEWLTGIFITHLLEQGRKPKRLPMIISEGEHEIPIAMATDNNYTYPTLVAVASILNSAKSSTTYDFHFMISNDFSEENKNLISNVCNGKKCRFRFVEMRDAYNDANISIAHITKVTYYRLKLPSLLPEIKKCIYLDSDIIVKSDLSEMFRTCIDDKHIAGVRALGYFENDGKIKSEKERLGIDSMEDYVNAGVLLLNLEKLRRDNMEVKFEELLQKNFHDQDQDILNVACCGNIRRIPFKFNAMTKYPLLSDVAWKNTPYLQKWIEKSDWDNGRKNPAIIHYVDKKKPWNDLSSIYAKDWWDVVNALDDDISKKIYAKYLPNLVAAAWKANEDFNMTYAHKRDALNEAKRLGQRIRGLEKKLNDVERSRSYKLGRFILWGPRKFRGGIRCLKQNGFKYTARRVLEKMRIVKQKKR